MMTTRLLLLTILLAVSPLHAEYVSGPDPAGSTAAANPVQVGGRDSDGKVRALKVGTDGALTIASGVTLAKSTSGTTAQVALSTSASVAAAANSARHSLLIRNADATISIYIGFTSGVTSSTGFILKAGESTTLYTTAAIYAIAASGTPTLHTLSEND